VKYVLDTNVVSRVLDGDERVLGPLAAVEPHDVGIPMLVLAELLFGAEKSGRREENRRRVQVVTERFPVLPIGLAIAERYAAVRAEVERHGRRKSDFDLVIACTALEQGAVLVTNDAALKDGAIVGLVVEDWLSAALPE
jgi:tRNA(fMet)-specific endonuclease VapC